MNINTDSKIVARLYQALKHAPKKLKNLNQKEREVVMVAFKSINGTDTPPLTKTQKYQIDNIIRPKLQASTDPPSSNFLKKLIKGFLNSINKRVSSAKINKTLEEYVENQIFKIKEDFIKNLVDNNLMKKPEDGKTFTFCECLDIYRALCIKIHPDKSEESKKLVQELNNIWGKFKESIEILNGGKAVSREFLTMIDQKYGLKQDSPLKVNRELRRVDTVGSTNIGFLCMTSGSHSQQTMGSLFKD